VTGWEDRVPEVIGLVLALAVSLYARVTRLDRDRALYPVVLVVIASYYVLFAVMGGSDRVIIIESLVAGGFAVAATVGFRRSLWLVAAALGAHGVLDLFHARVVANPGVPAWWPGFCLAYDVTAAAWLTGLLLRGTSAPAAPAESTLSENPS
jgi:hypothetical protein